MTTSLYDVLAAGFVPLGVVLLILTRVPWKPSECFLALMAWAWIGIPVMGALAP